MKALLATMLTPIYGGLLYFAGQGNHWGFGIMISLLAVPLSLLTVTIVNTKKRKKR